jgi:gliding motility-associated-like protein
MRFITTLICTIGVIKLLAQTAQLPLDQGRFTGITSLVEVGKDSFVYGASVIPPNFFGGGKTNNLTQYSLSKGVLWSFDFQYSKTSIPSKLTSFKDGFLWAGFVFDVNQNKSLMRLNKKGDIIWSKRYGGLNDVDTANSGVTESIVLPDGNIALAGGASVFGRTVRANDLFLAKLDSNGNQIWAKNYVFSTLPNTYTNFSNVINTTDGGFLICGSIYTLFDKSILLLKTDANGVIQWTRSYSNGDVNVTLNDELGVQVLQAANNNYILVANQKEIINGNSGQIVAQMNADGSVFSPFIVRVNAGSNYTLQANKAIYDVSKNALIIGAGVVQDSFPNVSVEQNLLYKVGLNGIFEWKYNYYDEILVGFVTSNSDLVETKNGNFAHLTSFSVNFDNLYPILIVSNSKGETGCQKPINLTVERNFRLTAKTFTITERNASPAIDYAVTKTPFKFSPKIPSLNLGNDTAICKTDTSIVLNANNPDFETYKWSTGATTPNITITQLGQYAVTVTSKKFCLTLSDTISITKSTKCDNVQQDSFKLDIPNAFTPNNDGLNDTFAALGKGFTVKSFQIYNRLGNLVFSGDGNDAAWDGKNRDQDAASDVYVYVLKYLVNNKEMRTSGEVALIR